MCRISNANFINLDGWPPRWIAVVHIPQWDGQTVGVIWLEAPGCIGATFPGKLAMSAKPKHANCSVQGCRQTPVCLCLSTVCLCLRTWEPCGRILVCRQRPAPAQVSKNLVVRDSYSLPDFFAMLGQYKVARLHWNRPRCVCSQYGRKPADGIIHT